MLTLTRSPSRDSEEVRAAGSMEEWGDGHLALFEALTTICDRVGKENAAGIALNFHYRQHECELTHTSQQP